MNKVRDVVIVSNSPGEIFSWVRIIAERIKTIDPELRVIIFLVPCPYATGNEKLVADNYKSVDMVVPPLNFLQTVFFGKLPDDYVPSDEGVVVFLGGDYWHAASLSWRLNFPAIAYAARAHVSWANRFNYFLCATERVANSLNKKGIPRGKLITAGHLVVEGVKPTVSREEGFKKWNLNPDHFTLGIFPGSRLYNLQDSLPVFLKVAEEIQWEIPETQFLVGISPFRTMEEVEDVVTRPSTPVKGRKGVIVEDEAGPMIETETGIRLRVMHREQYDMINMSDLVMTIPGTNTAECAYMGTPLVVISSWKARVPPIGLGPLVNRLPYGKLRRFIFSEFVKKLGYIALPNLIAQELIIPEIKVENDSSEITDVILDLIRDGEKRERMGARLKEVMGKSGAAEKISQYILKTLRGEEKVLS